MIINQEKLQGCSKQVWDLVRFLEITYGNVIVNSGFRSKELNDSLPNSSKASFHLTGDAVDVSVKDINVCKIITKVLDNIGKFPVRGIGIDIYANYAHFDFRHFDSVVYWSYNKKGEVA